MQIAVALATVLLVAGCSTQPPEDKAKKLITEHLFKTLHDYKSYESVDYGKLDTLYSSVSNDSLYKFYAKKFDEFYDVSKESADQMKIYVGLYSYNRLYNLYKERSFLAQDSMKYFLTKLTERDSLFKPTFVGWKMNHSYRAKSLGGNLGIHHYSYHFNKDFTEVLDYIDIGENDDTKREENHL